MIRKLEYFQVTNLLANTTVLAALVVLLGYAMSGLGKDGPAPAVHLVGPKWMLFAGTSVFSFECINFVIPMYQSHAKKDTFSPILISTLGFVVVLFIGFGGVNYLRYGAHTKDVVTLNLPPEDVAGKVIPFAFAFASLSNVPLFLFPASTLFESRCFERGPSTLKRKWQKNMLRTLLILVCTGISIVGVDKVEALVSFIGSFCCVPLAFIYPTIFYIRVCRPGFMETSACIAICCIGFVLFVLTTYLAFLDFSHGPG